MCIACNREKRTLKAASKAKKRRKYTGKVPRCWHFMPDWTDQKATSKLKVRYVPTFPCRYSMAFMAHSQSILTITYWHLTQYTKSPRIYCDNSSKTYSAKEVGKVQRNRSEPRSGPVFTFRLNRRSRSA